MYLNINQIDWTVIDCTPILISMQSLTLTLHVIQIHAIAIWYITLIIVCINISLICIDKIKIQFFVVDAKEYNLSVIFYRTNKVFRTLRWLWIFWGCLLFLISLMLDSGRCFVLEPGCPFIHNDQRLIFSMML